MRQRLWAAVVEMCIRDRYSHGVDPKLDFSDMPDICATYERVTRMHIYERTPYAGQLVFKMSVSMSIMVSI